MRRRHSRRIAACPLLRAQAWEEKADAVREKGYYEIAFRMYSKLADEWGQWQPRKRAGKCQTAAANCARARGGKDMFQAARKSFPHGDSATSRTDLLDLAETRDCLCAEGEMFEWDGDYHRKSHSREGWGRYVAAAQAFAEGAERDDKLWRRAFECARLGELTHIEDNASLARPVMRWIEWPAPVTSEEGPQRTDRLAKVINAFGPGLCRLVGRDRAARLRRRCAAVPRNIGRLFTKRREGLWWTRQIVVILSQVLCAFAKSPEPQDLIERVARRAADNTGKSGWLRLVLNDINPSMCF